MNYKDISNQELIKIVTSGCKFKYYSYDHKKAIQEYKQVKDVKLKEGDYGYSMPNPNCYDMPKELKDKYLIEKIGKLREIHFAPNGNAWRFKIGSKYAKSFKVEDFGVNVFPILD